MTKKKTPKPGLDFSIYESNQWAKTIEAMQDTMDEMAKSYEEELRDKDRILEQQRQRIVELQNKLKYFEELN